MKYRTTKLFFSERVRARSHTLAGAKQMVRYSKQTPCAALRRHFASNGYRKDTSRRSQKDRDTLHISCHHAFFDSITFQRTRFDISFQQFLCRCTSRFVTCDFFIRPTVSSLTREINFIFFCQCVYIYIYIH